MENRHMLLRKMDVFWEENPPEKKDFLQGQTFEKCNVSYLLEKEQLLPGQRLSLKHNFTYACSLCAKTVKKLYDIYCYPCWKTKAQADLCVLNPHNCHYFKGTCREPQWGQDFCFQPHYVYLSFTHSLKVGITRQSHIPGRWMDQGATLACVLAQTPSRRAAGILEHFLTRLVSDKTHWLKMLQMGNRTCSHQEIMSCHEQCLKLLNEHRKELEEVWSKDENSSHGMFTAVFPKEPSEIIYPMETNKNYNYNSLRLDKICEIDGTILGIKGQYILLDNGVFNVRRHTGFQVERVFS